MPPSLVDKVKELRPAVGEETAAVLPAVPDTALYPLRAPTEEAATAATASMQDLQPLKAFMREQEQAHLNRALQSCNGDKERAALALGISLATLYRKLGGEEKEA